MESECDLLCIACKALRADRRNLRSLHPRSTAIYAHIQHEPSRRAANRVSKKIAAALSPKTASTGPLTLVDQKLMQALKSRFAKADTSARKLRKAIAALVEQSGASIEASDAA